MKVVVLLLFYIYIFTYFFVYDPNRVSFLNSKAAFPYLISCRQLLKYKNQKAGEYSVIKPLHYIWGHDDEYNLACSRIQTIFSSTNRVLTYKYFPYGMGNLLYSVVAVAAIAITHNYRLYCIHFEMELPSDDYPTYNEFFESCFSPNVLKGNEKMKYDKKCINHRACTNILCTYGRKPKPGEMRAFFETPSMLIGGSLMEIERLFTNGEYEHELNKVFFGIRSGSNVANVRRTLLRLLLNPEPKLKKMYLEERSRLIKLKYTIGLQLRMGGDLANTNEDYKGVPISRIDDVIDQIRDVIKRKGWAKNVQLYISSDSSLVIDLIRNKTRNEFPVVTSQLFQKGHTEFLLDNDISRNVFVDMYYMSMSDHLFVTWQSSLGRLMCFLSDSRCDAVLDWWKRHKSFTYPTIKPKIFNTNSTVHYLVF